MHVKCAIHKRLQKQPFEIEQQEYDKARTEYLEELGYKVIRFTNDDVRYNIHAVADEILQAIEDRIAELKIKQ